VNSNQEWLPPFGSVTGQHVLSDVIRLSSGAIGDRLIAVYALGQTTTASAESSSTNGGNAERIDRCLKQAQLFRLIGPILAEHILIALRDCSHSPAVT
jgi:hypothetical protein